MKRALAFVAAVVVGYAAAAAALSVAVVAILTPKVRAFARHRHPAGRRSWTS